MTVTENGCDSVEIEMYKMRSRTTLDKMALIQRRSSQGHAADKSHQVGVELRCTRPGFEEPGNFSCVRHIQTGRVAWTMSTFQHHFALCIT